MIPTTKSQEPALANGMTAKEWVDLLKTDKAVDGIRSLRYFDGEQEPELIKVLNDPSKGRKKWRERGLIPRFRNITRNVVEKSGLLFKDQPPVMELYSPNSKTPNPTLTDKLHEELAKVEFTEFAINLDAVVRLMKTAMVLVQWSAEDAAFIFDILHRGNCEVVIDPTTRKIDSLIQATSAHKSIHTYRIWTKTTIIDLMELENSQLVVTNQQNNPYGVVPVAVFYDTNIPRSGFWVEQDKSLVNLNEMVNLHITDSEYSILWSKMSTLFTNVRPAQADASLTMVDPNDSSSGRSIYEIAGVGGPGQAIVLDTIGVEQPFVRYENPNIDIAPLDQVVTNWIQNYAGDWSVRIHSAGEAKASSGFQLVVEEMNNLDLRRSRQRMFENSFKRWYKIVARVFNVSTGSNAFAEDDELFVHFAKPRLPVEEESQEVVWSMKIKEGRATEVDYLMVVEGLTREEAELKFLEIVAFNKRKQALLVDAQPTTATGEAFDGGNNADKAQADANTPEDINTK